MPPDVPGWDAPGLGYPSIMERAVERENRKLRAEVERLKAAVKELVDKPAWEGIQKLEAEVERLKAALIEIADGSTEQPITIARAALEEKTS